MRVLYFTQDYTPHDFRFLSALAESRHQIYALRMENRGRSLEKRLLPDGIQAIEWAGGHHPVYWWNYPGLIKDLRRVISSVMPDVIHAGPIQSAAFLTALSGYSPLVSMSWGSDLLLDADRNIFMQMATRYTLQHTAVLIGDCQAVKNKAVDFGFSPDRIVLFPWGVNLDHFSPSKEHDIRNKLNWENDFVLLSLRTWEPLYGVDVIIKAFIKAAKNNPHIKLLLLGSGSQEKLLRDMLEANDLMQRVNFAGRINNHDLPDFYRSADIYLSASHSDGSSVSLMESLACGCPVIVSDIDGNKEWITPGQQGWLFPDGDENALANYILDSYEKREKLNQMRKQARDLAEMKANWSSNVQNLFKAYEKAIEMNK